MKFTKITSTACVLFLLFFGNTWAVAGSGINSNWNQIGIATSQNTMNTPKGKLKNIQAKLEARLCTLSPRDNINARIQSTLNKNQQAKEQVC